jgi:5'-deoxynucleotidase YfbR-like HD superfamily hydrolase
MIEKYNDITEDLFKIYLSILDANKAKIFQNINSKYTVIDKTMIASYIYLKMLSELKLPFEGGINVLINNLLKPVVLSETGNIFIELDEYDNTELFESVTHKLIQEKFEYKNRILKSVKIEFEDSNDEYIEYEKIWRQCETLSELFILLELYLNGNVYAYEKMVEKINKIDLLYIETFNDITKKIFEEFKSIIIIDNMKTLINSFKTSTVISKYYNLLQVTLKLKSVMRFSQVHLLVEEDVLIHTYIDTIINLLICNYLIKNGEKINKTDLVTKCLFHDFGEFKGNEIIIDIKLYNEKTREMFKNIEEKDEADLEDLIGEEFFSIVKNYKKGCTGYISDVIDKIVGVMKVYVEIEYFGNYNFLKSIKALYKERIEKFNDFEKIESLKDKKILKNLVDYVFIYIKGNLLNKYSNDKLTNYYTKKELEDMSHEVNEWNIDLLEKSK